MNKAAIIINPDVPTGLLANAVACITSGLFHNETDLVGEKIEGKDVVYIPITKIPILILKPGTRSLLDIAKEVQKANIKHIIFTREAQQTTDYTTYTESVVNKSLEEVNIVGIGVVGPEKTINSLTGNLPMLR